MSALVFRGNTCGHWHSTPADIEVCRGGATWLYDKATQLADDLDLGRIGAYRALRSGGTATGPDEQLAEDRRPLTERKRATSSVLPVGRAGNAWGAGFPRLALGTLTALAAAYIVVTAVRNYTGRK